LDANLEIFGNACKIGLAFWAPKLKAAYIGDPIIFPDEPFNIFYNEAIVILAALEWAASSSSPPKRLAIHTDSTNSLNIFNSLHATDFYNPILMSAITTHIESGIDLRVFQIEGKCNVIADALSCRNFEHVKNIYPSITIHHFEPPALWKLGAYAK
jgi:hypothetical protein